MIAQHTVDHITTGQLCGPLCSMVVEADVTYFTSPGGICEMSEAAFLLFSSTDSSDMVVDGRIKLGGTSGINGRSSR